jgi:WD40 repeat protein
VDRPVVAAATAERAVVLWDTVRGDAFAALRGHTAAVYRVAFSADGWRLATASADGTVKTWVTPSPVPFGGAGKPRSVYALAFHPGGRAVAAAGRDRTVRVWDVGMRVPKLVLRGHTGVIHSLAYSTDGGMLASADDVGVVNIWDTSTGACRRTLPDCAKAVTGLAFSPDGRLLACAGADGTVRVWNSDTGESHWTLRGHSGPVRAVAFSPDGQLASAGQDGTVRIWDLTLGKELLTLRGRRGAVRCLAFSPDGRLLASGGEDQKIKLHDADTGQDVFDLPSGGGAVLSVAFGTAGRLASTGDGKTIKIWDTHTGQHLIILHGPEDAINSVAFDRAGELLASGSLRGGLKVWGGWPLAADDTDQRQALALLEMLGGKTQSLPQLRERIIVDQTIAESVRRRALDLVEPYRNDRVRRDADTVVQSLGDKVLPKPDLLDAITTMPGLEDAVRTEALVQAADYVEDPDSQNLSSRLTIRRTGQEPPAYRLALRQAEAACRLCPENAEYQTTRGIACYRLKQYRDALDAMRQAGRLYGDGKGTPPALLAFLAMTEYQLDNHQDARKTLARLGEVMRQPQWANQVEARGFLAESEALLGARPPVGPNKR